jgi:thiazole/oxazole-forming peptide maturase SagD family component
VQRGTLRFLRGDEEVSVKAPARLLSELARLCDGRQTREQILRKVSDRWQVNDVKALLEALTEAGLIVEAADQCAALWEQHVANPQRFVEPVDEADVAGMLDTAQDDFAPRPHVEYEAPAGSPLLELLARRRSVRAFSEVAVDPAAVRSLLWAVYGVAAGTAEFGLRHRTVPSGGQLYPLEIFYCNLRQTGPLARGVYATHYAADGRVGLTRWIEDVERLVIAMAEPDLLRSAQGVIVIAGRFSRLAAKYGNRALAMVTLEAGHAAQNALLAATELKLAAVEVGGFVDSKLTRACGMASDLTPVTTVIFGQPASAERAEAARRARREAPEHAWADVGTEKFAAAEYIAMAKFHGGTITTTTVDWSYGRDRDPMLAHDKAVAEAWERRAYRQIENASWISARCDDLEGAVRPDELVRYADWQYALPGFPGQRFQPALPRDWVACESIEHGTPTAWVPIELVFHRDSLSKAQRDLALTRTASSGMAAYTTLEGAVERALLEVIERDAFMVNWLTRRASPAIARHTLPGELVRRLRALEQGGFRVVLKDLTLDSAPVVLAFAQNAELHQTLITAAAAFAGEDAAAHALSELESSAAAIVKSGGVAAIEPAGVFTPSDHVQLYGQKKHFRRADWLANDERSIALDRVGFEAPKSFERLTQALRLQGYRILWRDMTIAEATLEQGRVPLRIARVLVPGMVRISFGLGTEMLGLPRLARFGGLPRRVRRPLFPHPFP